MKFLFTYDSMCKSGCGALRNGVGDYCIDCRDKRISEKRRKYNDEYYRKLRVKK